MTVLFLIFACVVLTLGVIAFLFFLYELLVLVEG